MAQSDMLSKLLQRAQTEERKPDGAPARLVLSGPALIALSLILVCAVAWAFFMGLMVGRGQSPREEIHAMTGMLAPAEEGRQEGEILAVPPQAAAPQASVHAPPGGQAAQAWPSLMPDAPAKTEPAKKPAPPKRAERTPKRPQPQNADARNEQKFAYVFQAAAFKTQGEAARLQKELSAKGARASFRKSGSVYLVLINLRGGQSDVEKLNALLRSMRLGKPLPISKKPVGAAARAKKAS